jgi:hypothetical protein
MEKRQKKLQNIFSFTTCKEQKSFYLCTPLTAAGSEENNWKEIEILKANKGL